MKKGSVWNGGFDPVADGVAEVEEGTNAGGFLFVLFDNTGFDGHVAGDEFGGDVLIERVEGFEVREHGLIADGSMFDHFGKALTEFATMESK